MTSRQVRRFIDAMIAGRRPRGFQADADDARTIRTTITLATPRRDLAAPREEFLSGLFDELTELHAETPVLIRRANRPARTALISIAAAGALIAGTFGATEAFTNHRSVPAVASAGPGIHSSQLVDARRHAVGQINLYNGNPAWVFMDLRDPGYTGTVACELQSPDGRVVVTGIFQVSGGEGEWARTIPVSPGKIRSAQIVTADGQVVARAVF